ncbi:MAG: beta-N-acetylhexosaminidase [Acidiferrobacterales bacterium]
MTLGPLMLDLQGAALTPTEREYLQHPMTGGVILFERNYASLEQLDALVAEIHDARPSQLLVAVDQEGGRVQRFRKDFTLLPAARRFGTLYDENRKRAKRLAEASGWLMATELRAVGVDISFAPVLDLARGTSEVIGDRAFHPDPDAVTDLAHSYVTGMNEAGMAATGKHFPGHGSVAADSHVTLPLDQREYADIYNEDLVPFERMIEYGLAALMVAHVAYSCADSEPADYSGFWVQDELRNRLGFQGVIFSDDLSMAGAQVIGGPVDRAQTALAAGCDMVLMCNDSTAVEAILDVLTPPDDPASQMRLIRMRGRHPVQRQDLADDSHYQQAKRMLTSLV